MKIDFVDARRAYFHAAARRDIYVKLPKEDSEEAECMLADYLRSEGYGVWEGKRGKKCKETYLFD